MASNGLSGGLRVVLQQAEGLADRGLRVTVVSPDPAPEWASPLQKAEWEHSIFARSKALTAADVRIATFWTTVEPASQGSMGPVFHLCQGYEGDFSFYAAKKTEIEQAYAKPLHKLAIAPHIETRLRAAGYGPVSYVGQTFDPGEFPALGDRSFQGHPPRILLTGIFEADVKGIREALQALARLRRTGTAFTLLRVSLMPQSKAEHDILPADEYLLRVPPEQMPEIYRQSDLLISPSHPEEGFGLPVLEALSSGLPVVLSDTPAHRHMARGAAEYFRCKDIDSLCQALSRLLQDSPRRAELSARGPKEADRFSTAMVVDLLIELIEKALDA